MLPLVLLAVTQSASTWQQGDVCTGTNGTSPRFMLTGKHLIVGDEHWPPYSSIDRASGTWEGFDHDLIDAVANLLGFTYTIMEFNAQPPVAQTNDDGAILSRYNAYLHDLEDGALPADLLMSYWTINAERRSMKDLIMLSPHAEGATPVLSYIPAPVEALGRPTLPFADAVKVATLPFTLRAWLTLLGILFISTVTMGLLEWHADAKSNTEDAKASKERKSHLGSFISASFYFSTQLIAQAGGHKPKSRLGGMFMGFFALFTFVSVVIYGSSLTAALTAASVNKNSAIAGHTVRSLIDQSRTVCIRERDGNFRRLRNKYASQGLTFTRVQSPITTDGATIDGATEMLRRMRMPRYASERCHAAVITQGVYDKWTASGVSEERQGYANVIAAHFGLAGSVNASLARSQCGELDTVDAFDTGRGKTASWVTTSRGLCVGRAFDWAISNLVMEGTLAEIEARWFPRAHACASSANRTGAEEAWTNEGLSVDVDELMAIIIFWTVGLLLTAVGWLLPGSHEVIEQGRLSDSLKRARRSVIEQGRLSRSLAQRVSVVSRIRASRRESVDDAIAVEGVDEDDRGSACGDGREVRCAFV